jgi:hypothetical protein
MNQPPRKLRRRIEECLREAAIAGLEKIIRTERGPVLVLKSGPLDPSRGPYVWWASLPDGQVMVCVTNRPVPPAKRPYFPAIVAAVADAVQRGLPVGGLQVQHTPACAAVSDHCICTPTVKVLDGRAARDATHVQMIGACIWAGVPVL